MRALISPLVEGRPILWAPPQRKHSHVFLPDVLLLVIEYIKRAHPDDLKGWAKLGVSVPEKWVTR